MSRGWSTPRTRRPGLIRWSGAECPDCGDPVETVHLKADPLRDDGSRVRIERAVTGRVGEPGWIAARVIAGQMIGYRISKTRPLIDGYQAFRPHAAVCSEAPPPLHEQESLFNN